MKHIVTLPQRGNDPLELKFVRLPNGNVLIPKRRDRDGTWVEVAPGSKDYAFREALLAEHEGDARNAHLTVQVSDSVAGGDDGRAHAGAIQLVVGPMAARGPKVKRWDVLEQLVHQHGWKKGAEIGVRDGRTSLHLLKTCPALYIVCVDLFEVPSEEEMATGLYPRFEHLPEYERRLRKVFAEKYPSRTLIIKGSSVDAATGIADGSLDFAFIDADHEEPSVRADIEAWRPKIRPGGMLLGHDAQDKFPGVLAAIDDLCKGWTLLPDHVWAWQL